MKRLLATSVLVAVLCLSQTSPKFDAAAIRLSAPDAGPMQFGVTPSGIMTAKNVTAGRMIQQAWNVRDFQLAGGPAWMNTQGFDINARGTTGVSEADIASMSAEQRNQVQARLTEMLKSLLADRFALRVHTETREGSVYALTIAKSGIRMQPSTADIRATGLNTSRGPGGITVTGIGVSLTQLVRLLSNQLGRQVVDNTGLTSTYDFKLVFAPLMSTEPDPGNAASIFTAIQDQLGLRLDSAKEPVEVLVIDDLRKPTEN